MHRAKPVKLRTQGHSPNARGVHVACACLGMQEAAREAYARRDFAHTLELVDQLVAAEPEVARWHEMRASVLVDGKRFEPALQDYARALAATTADSRVERARLLAGRGLALEGLAEWEAALADYNQALLLARAAGQFPDPYVLNSRGNVLASLGRWKGVQASTRGRTSRLESLASRTHASELLALRRCAAGLPEERLGLSEGGRLQGWRWRLLPQARRYPACSQCHKVMEASMHCAQLVCGGGAKRGHNKGGSERGTSACRRCRCGIERSPGARTGRR